jgi:hypothetical protein
VIGCFNFQREIMKTLAQIGQLKEGVAESVSKDGFTVDTTYVLFFLAVEFGRTIGSFEIDTVFIW